MPAIVSHMVKLYGYCGGDIPIVIKVHSEFMARRLYGGKFSLPEIEFYQLGRDVSSSQMFDAEKLFIAALHLSSAGGSRSTRVVLVEADTSLESQAFVCGQDWGEERVEEYFIDPLRKFIPNLSY